jgi:hypothetical protein
MKKSVDQFAEIAAKTAMRASAAYLRANGMEAEPETLCTALRSWIRIKFPEALLDAKQALAIGMGQVADATFRATMAECGILAAKEVGFSRADD